MKVKATIKVTVKALLAQWKQVLLMYAVFPLLLIGVMGYFQRDLYKPETKIDAINISIVDEDKSDVSKNFISLLSSDELKNLFNISDNGDYIINIPKNYEKDLLQLKDTTITIDEKNRVSRQNEVIIKSLIEQYGKSLTESLIVNNNMDLRDNEEIINKITATLKSINETTSIKSNKIEAERVLTSFENQSASMMTFMLFTIIMGCVAGYHLDKENGSFKRLMSTSITKQTFFKLDLLIFFMSSFVYGGIYVIVSRIAGFAFKGVSLINIIVLLSVQSILITALSGLIIAFLSKKVSQIVIILFIYFQIIFGGGFIPLKEISNKVFLTIAKFSPGDIITDAYRKCMLFNSIKDISTELILMLAISIAAYLISITKVRLRWEE
ncbi:ABC transporter permease [Clostridium intestinale]|uniref:ABC-2 type transport system permease protein n=1 Tax=Clostridium intestinale DSM 6191 TaxID=1121320 RepID=A0A1M6A7Z0_9CLOT|nr:ABC transporter permease [Clostridium intestinale]SHI32588.1 ABC-2 type transport system permease protein [Clostridium intestinale DSM 6191]